MYLYLMFWLNRLSLFAPLSKSMVALVICMFYSNHLMAFEVSPLVMEITPSGDGATANIDIKNPHEYQLILELSAIERNIDPDGTEIEVSAEDDFLIFPPQLLVDPRASQRVQIRYIGQPVASSKAYRIIVHQVPVKQTNDEPTRLDIAFTFKTAVYVIPDGAKMDIDILESRQLNNGDLFLTLENRGNRHAVISSEPWKIVNKQGTSTEIDSRLIPEVKSSPLVPANSKRNITIPASFVTRIGDIETILIDPSR